MCQVKQAIEGLGWMCWGARVGCQVKARGVLLGCRGLSWDPQQDKLGEKALGPPFFLACVIGAGRSTIVKSRWIERCHVALPHLFPVEEGALSSQDGVQRLGGGPKGRSNCHISDLCFSFFFVVLSLYLHICKSTLAPAHETEIQSMCVPAKAARTCRNQKCCLSAQIKRMFVFISWLYQTQNMLFSTDGI